MSKELGERLSQSVLKQISKVIYFSQAEKISSGVAVHEVRKSFKRIRALLRLYKTEDYTYFSSVASQLAEFGRILSPYRNSCVNLTILEKILVENMVIPDARLKELKRVLLEKNSSYLEHQLLKNNVRQNVGDYFLAIENKFQEGSCQPEFEEIAQQINTTYCRARQLFSLDDIEKDAELLHSLRKRLKVLFYQMSFLRYRNARFFKLKADQLDISTELLGDDHDLFVFGTEIRNPEYGLNPEEYTILLKKIQHQRDLIWTKLQPRLKQFLSDTPEAFMHKVRSFL